MTDSNQSKSQNWWTTLPGILTGVAAVLTAVSGLIIAFHQVSSRETRQDVVNQTGGGSHSDVRGSGAAPGSITNGTASTATASSGAGIELPLPSINEVKLDAGNTVVKILKAELQPFNAEKRALKFVVRHTNNGHYPANFWSSSYRLIVDDVPQAPTNF